MHQVTARQSIIHNWVKALSLLCSEEKYNYDDKQIHKLRDLGFRKANLGKLDEVSRFIY